MTQLGFLDEPVTEHFEKEVDFTTNKLGGFPNWIDQKNDKKKIACHICGSITPLLLQIYAPITERPHHHRTLYIFACVNADCWNNPKSWRCLKDQFPVKEKTKLPSLENSTFTLDDWPSSDTDWNCDHSNRIDSTASWGDEASAMINRVSLVEENGNELPGVAFVESKSCIATAEIEPDEDEPITIDSPVIPNYNLVNLLKAKPSSPKMHNGNVHFVPWFIYATEEKIAEDPHSDEHVQNLLAEYTKNRENLIGLKTMNNVNVVEVSKEDYEKSCPAHGDRLFFTFVSRIKANPEQVMRYCRKNSAPLFLYDADVPIKCKYCQSNVVFEVQILPTIINHLKLSGESRNQYQHLEFGSAYVYTCEASCDKSEEEIVIVQYEQF